MVPKEQLPPEHLVESAEDLYENAPCGYCSSLPDGTLIRANQTFLRWMGYEESELIGRRRFNELLTAGGRIFYETHYHPLLQMQGAVREIALDMVRSDGRKLPVLVNAVVKRGEDGRPILTRTTVFNATDRRRYENELLAARRRAEEADRIKEQFISMISHEIRTPLNAVMTAMQLLARTDLNADQSRYVRILDSSSRNLLELVNSVLDLSRLNAGKAVSEKGPLNLEELARRVVRDHRARAETNGLELVVEIDAEIPSPVIGETVHLYQVLNNLLSNAMKFTHEGRVALRLTLVEQSASAVSVLFEVEDSGIGIPAAQQQKIFEDFTQASDQISSRYGGTGLGLSISQRLVASMGSKIELESEEGRGARFFFTLLLDLPSAA